MKFLGKKEKFRKTSPMNPKGGLFSFFLSDVQKKVAN
jgi:hypothetical protein